MRWIGRAVLNASLCALAMQARLSGQSLAGSSELPKSAVGTCQIAGVVVDAKSGSPLRGVDMTITPLGEEGNGASKTSTEDGAFVFNGLQARKYRLVASRRGYVTAAYQQHQGFSTAIVTGPGLDTSHLRFQIVPGAILSGSVIDDAGDAVSGAIETLFRQDPASGSGKVMRAEATTSDDAGAFEFTRLESGTYFVATSARPWYAFHPQQRHRSGDGTQPNQEPPRSPLDVAYATTYYADTTDSASATPIALRAGDHSQITMTLHPEPAVQFRMKVPQPPADSNGAPARRFAPPSLTQTAFGTTEMMILTQSGVETADGESYFEISGLAPGEYTLDSHGENGEVQGSSEITLTGDQVLDGPSFAVGTEVRGTLITAFGAQAPEDLSLSLEAVNRHSRASAQKVSNNGAFTLHDVAPGLYELLVWGGSLQLPVLEIRTAGRTTEGGRIQIGTDAVTLQADIAIGSATINGFVQSNGQGLAGAMVVLMPHNPVSNSYLIRRYQSDSDGSFTLQRVVPGHYTLIAIDNGWDLEWAREGALQKYLPQGKRVEVRGESTKIDLAEPVEAQQP